MEWLPPDDLAYLVEDAFGALSIPLRFAPLSVIRRCGGGVGR